MHWNVETVHAGNRNNCSRRDCDGSLSSVLYGAIRTGLKDLGVNGVLLPMLDKDISDFLTQHATGMWRLFMQETVIIPAAVTVMDPLSSVLYGAI